MNFEEIEEKHKELIDIARKYMLTIKDNEHDIQHMEDVVKYTKQILCNIQEKVDAEVCIICAYWHDIGRTKIGEGHERLSADMLEKKMNEMGYDKELINKCVKAIEFHKWNMAPTTLEGLLVKDADKIAWVGSGRWNSCLENNQRLDNLIELLPKLRNEILYFDCSRKIYDEEVVKIMTILYNKIYN